MGQGALILRHAERHRQPVLPALPALGADPDGRPRHDGHGHRLAGGDLRRLLGHPPGRPAGLPAAADDPPHLATRRSARSTRPGINWGIFVAVRRARRRLRLLPEAGLGLRDRRHRHPGDRHASCSSSSCATCGASRCGSCSPARALFLTVDLTFFAANLTKVLHGGWFPLSIALIVFVVLTTWQRGREIVTRNRTEEEGPLQHVRRRGAGHGPTGQPPAAHRRLPQRQPRDDPPGATREPRAQPGRPRVRGDHLRSRRSAFRTSPSPSA